MTKTQNKILALTLAGHIEFVTEWDLLVRGLPITAADALVRKGRLNKETVGNEVRYSFNRGVKCC